MSLRGGAMSDAEQADATPRRRASATFTPPEPIRFLSRSNRASIAEEAAKELRSFGVCGVIGFLPVVLSALQPLLGKWAWLTGLLGLAVIGAVIGLYVSSRRVRLGSADLAGRYAGQSSDRPVRLSCVGSVPEIEADGPLVDVPFEPRLFWASLAVPPRRGAKTLLFCATMVVGLVSWRFAGHVLGWDTIGIAYFWGAYVVGAVCYAWFRPIYYRVVPGRLDVLRFSAIWRRAVSVQSYDLRKTPVLVDLRRHMVFVGPPAKADDFSFALVPGRKRFARAVFMAAVSTYEPGPLPHDELLG